MHIHIIQISRFKLGWKVCPRRALCWRFVVDTGIIIRRIKFYFLHFKLIFVLKFLLVSQQFGTLTVEFPYSKRTPLLLCSEEKENRFWAPSTPSYQRKRYQIILEDVPQGGSHSGEKRGFLYIKILGQIWGWLSYKWS